MARQNELNTPAPKALDLIAALKAVGPAIAAATSFEVAAKAFLGNSGFVGVLIPILSTVGLLITSGYVIYAKTREASESGRKIPKFATSVRIIGLFGMTALFGLLTIRVWKARPNTIDGQTYEAGFLCDSASGRPLNEGKVVILSRGGTPMSSAQDLDSRGFFYAELKKWSFLPGSLQVFDKSCKTPNVDITSVGSNLCPAAQDAGQNLPVVVHQWRVKCE